MILNFPIMSTVYGLRKVTKTDGENVCNTAIDRGI